ncbi:MAG: hypothetical protein QXX99_07455 [Candidatus Bathyarchaeia archaeon]
MNFRSFDIVALAALVAISITTFYTMNLNYFLLVKPLDIIWLNQGSNPLVSGNSVLFSCIIWFFTQLSLKPIDSINISAALALTLLSLTTFYFSRRVSGDRLGSFISALLSILFPSHVWLVCTSNYHILLGLTLVQVALLHLHENDMKPLRKAAMIAMFGLLISFTDFLSTMIFFVSALAWWLILLAFRRKISLMDVYPLFSATSLISLVFSRIQIVEPPITLLPMIIGMLMSIPAFILLIKERKSCVICCWLASSIIVTALTLPPLLFLYAALPAIISSFTLFTTYLKKMIAAAKEGEELYIMEIDIPKIVGLALLLLLIVSALISTHSVLNSVASETKIYVERYGYGDLLGALEWIKSNTPEGTVVLAEYPLSTWIKSYANRPTLGNYPVNFDKNVEEFMMSYDADTILNSNFEMRNLFLRLRDWGPVAPQRAPSFASSKDGKYLDFLYIDENHVNVKYSFRGETLKPDFYGYKERTVSWLVRSGEEAALQYVYALEGNVTIVKRIFLEKSPEATIEYSVTSTSSNIESFSVKMWIPKERKIGFAQISGNKFYFMLDSGEYVVEFQGNLKKLIFGPDEIWLQNRVFAVFEQLDNQILVRIIVRVLKAEPLTWMKDEVFSTSARELLTKYRVGYAVIPTAVKKVNMDRFGLDDELFKSQYENSKLTVYMVRV